MQQKKFALRMSLIKGIRIKELKKAYKNNKLIGKVYLKIEI